MAMEDNKNEAIKPRTKILKRSNLSSYFTQVASRSEEKVKETTSFKLPKRVRAISKLLGKKFAFDITNVAKKLGQGSFGAVYDYKGVAVKVAAGSKFNKTGYKELESEKKLLLEAEKTGVSPRVISSGEGFVAIEKFEGQPLVAWENRIRTDATFGNFIFAKILEAIGALNRKGIAHNDLHNGNIFVTEDFRIKIIDFGLAQSGYGYAYREALFGKYEEPYVGVISLIKEIFSKTPAIKTYYKILSQTVNELCEETGADPKYALIDYEELKTEEDEEKYYDNIGKILAPKDRNLYKKYIDLFYDRLDSAFRINSKNPGQSKSKFKNKIIANSPVVNKPEKNDSEVVPKTPIVENFARGGKIIKPTFSVVGEKKGTIRARTPLLSRKQKIDTIVKRSKNFALSASQLEAAMGNLRADDFRNLKPLIRKKPTSSLIRVNDNHLWSFLNRFNLFLDNFVRTLSTLFQYKRLLSEFSKMELKAFFDKERAINKELKKSKKARKERNKAKKKKADNLVDGVLLDPIILAGMSAISGGPKAKREVAELEPLSGSVTEKGVAIAKRLMTDLGIEDYQAAGIVANLIAEGLGSGRPDIIEGGEPGDPPPWGSTKGYGWAQWTNTGSDLYGENNRLNKFITRLGGGPNKKPRRPTDDDNYQYLISDFRNEYAFALQKLKSTKSANEATESIFKNYEGISDSTIDRRKRLGNTILQGLKNKQDTKTSDTDKDKKDNKPNKKASGGVLIPELFDQYKISTNDVTSNLTQFIVDRPTMIEMNKYNEPLIIIPTGRTKGREILNILFKKTFDKLENSYKMQNRMNNYNILLDYKTEESKNILTGKNSNIASRIDNRSKNIFYDKSVSSQKRVVIYTQDIYVT